MILNILPGYIFVLEVNISNQYITSLAHSHFTLMVTYLLEFLPTLRQIQQEKLK